MKEKYTPGEGCECSARCSCECGCDVDWTPREVYELREQRDRLAEALRSCLEEMKYSAKVGQPINENRVEFAIAEKALAAVKGGQP